MTDAALGPDRLPPNLRVLYLGQTNVTDAGVAVSKMLSAQPDVVIMGAGFMGNQCGIPAPKWRHRARALQG